MKVFGFFLTLALSLAVQAGPATIETPSGKVVCGGNIDHEELDFNIIPGNLVLKGTDSQEKVLIYIDLAKKRSNQNGLQFDFWPPR